MEENKLNDEKSIEELKCPECGSNSIIVQGRCLTCLECGFSLCSL